MQATHLFLEGDDLGWGAPGLGDDLGWGGEATCDAQGCGGAPPPLGLLERDIIISRDCGSLESFIECLEIIIARTLFICTLDDPCAHVQRGSIGDPLGESHSLN